MAATCKNCGLELPDDSGGSPELRAPCPSCGSKSRNYILYAGAGELKLTGNAVNLHRNLFVGREADLYRLNLLVDQRRRVISITGLSGVGKSALATEFIRQKTAFNPFWLNAASIFGRDATDELENELLRRVSDSSDFPLMVVIDGADALSADELRKYLKQILNFGRVATVILTGRDSLLELGEITEFELEPLSSRDLYNVINSRNSPLYDLDTIAGTPEKAEQSIIQVYKPEIIRFSNNLIEQLQKYPEDVFLVTSRQFEELVADLLADQGCEVQLTQKTRDGGKDIIASLNTPIGKILTLVEAKRHKPTNYINIGLIRQLHGALHDHDASHAMLVTTSYFSKDALDFQKRHQLELSLKEFEDVQDWITNYNRA